MLYLEYGNVVLIYSFATKRSRS